MFGINLKKGHLASRTKDPFLRSRSPPWLMIAPLINSNSEYLRKIKRQARVVTIGFSGWAVNNNYRAIMGLDYAMPLSDHCDYEELVEIVNQSKAEKIYTFHGFSTDFAKSLRELGFDALPIEDAGKMDPLSKRVNCSLDLFMNNG